jgi:hypothetical protein
MTHPLRDPKGRTQKRRVAVQGTPIDPADLSRRLTQHLEEQKARALKRRELAIRKEREAAGVYHHVPSVAASSFERTATPDALGKIHRLAAPAVKCHFQDAKIDNPSHGGRQAPNTLLKINQMKDQMIVDREMSRNRNQFQWTHGMEEALVADLERDLYKPPQRTFQHETSHVRIKHSTRTVRPLSTGDDFSEEEGDEAKKSGVVENSKLRGKAANEQVARDRHDWAQRDDESGNVQVKKQRSSLFLRRKDPGPVIIGKKEKVGIIREEGEEEGAGNGGFLSPSTRKGFLSRFKRHPS